jgi:hypothetical protein
VSTLLNSVEWTETNATPGDDGLPYATHSGVFEFAGHSLRCYRLSDGRAIFHADDFRAAFGELLNAQE